jgi:DMSO/TMAO reductase YedYZ molybdopterin-dependent catalytic subunit
MGWSLKVEGLVENEVELSLEELERRLLNFSLTFEFKFLEG